MQTTALTILDALVEATYSRRPEAALGRANLELEKLRLLCRLAQVPASPRCGSRVGRVSRRVFAGVTRLVV